MNTNMAAAMVKVPTLGPSSLPPPSRLSLHHCFSATSIPMTRITTHSNPNTNKSSRFPVISCCFNSTTEDSTISLSLSLSSSSPNETSTPLRPMKRRRRAQKFWRPGEKEGIAEEMRFVGMKLRKRKGKSDMEDDDSSNSDGEIDGDDGGINNENSDGEVVTWEPSLKGFISYLVDSELVFSTMERLIDESQDVSFAYFKNTGLERSESFRKDIDFFRQQNIPIPLPIQPGKRYAQNLEEFAAKTPPLFFTHVYNIYFSHIAGGQVIAKQVSEKILDGRELEICQWPGDPEELLKGLRENLNALGKHWSRNMVSRCLSATSRSYMWMGAIIRLIAKP